MGNNICSCIKPKEDLNEMQFNDESPSLPTIDNYSINNNIQFNTNLSDYYHEHEQTLKTKSKNIQLLQTQYNLSQIIILQSHIRSFIYRINYSLNIKHSLQLYEDSLIKTTITAYTHHNIKTVENALKLNTLPNDNSNIKKMIISIPMIVYTRIYLSTNKNNVPSIYIGQVTFDNIRHGYGILIVKNGSKYKGYWNNGEFSGYGSVITYKGNYYEGSFYNWQLNGKGIKRTIEGNVYKGNFVNFLKDGEGVEEVGQCKYTGTFNKDKRDGKGVIMVNKEVYNVVYINGILDDKYKYIEQMIK